MNLLGEGFEGVRRFAAHAGLAEVRAAITELDAQISAAEAGTTASGPRRSYSAVPRNL